MVPSLSSHFEKRLPSAIRQAQIIFAQRPDKNEVQVVNLAIGNVSLPMHPAMQKRMNELGEIGSVMAWLNTRRVLVLMKPEKLS